MGVEETLRWLGGLDHDADDVAWPEGGTVYKPQAGQRSDAPELSADLLAEPDRDVPAIPAAPDWGFPDLNEREG